MGEPGQKHRPSRRPRKHQSWTCRRRRPALAGLAAAAAALLVLAGCTSGGVSSPRPGGSRTVTHPKDGPVAAARQHPGSPAAAAATATLWYTNYIASGAGHGREVALTFDDGPSAYTPAVLRILHQAHAQATFFETGRAVRARPQVSRAVLAAGMAVGNHTQSHAFLTHLSPRSQAMEIDAVSGALQAASLDPTALFRPPYGAFNAATLAALHQRRMLMVLWSADTKDFSRPGVKRIVYVAVSGAKPGAIILMHDGGGDRAQTVAALPRIIRRLRQRHFRLVTIPQLLRDDPPPQGQRPPHSLAGH